MRKVINRYTTWHLINIKARKNQTTKHYAEVFEKLNKQDPMVSLPRGKVGSLKALEISKHLDENRQPKWIQVTILSYIIVDSEAFYNKRDQEDVAMSDWNSDIVANKKEAILYFIPSAHMLAVRRNSQISLKTIVKYLSEALNRVEPETFDVSPAVERDVLDKILKAHAILNLEAEISFSNPGHTDGFRKVFEDKIKEMNPNQLKFYAKGTKKNPLNKGEDGMINAIVNMAEYNGNLKATIQHTSDSKNETINTNDHPRILKVDNIADDVCSTLYNEIKLNVK